MLQCLVCVSWCACAALGSVSVRRAGWIDRAVSFYRGKFLNDVQEIAPVQIRGTYSLIHPPYLTYSFTVRTQSLMVPITHSLVHFTYLLSSPLFL